MPETRAPHPLKLHFVQRIITNWLREMSMSATEHTVKRNVLKSTLALPKATFKLFSLLLCPRITCHILQSNLEGSSGNANWAQLAPIQNKFVQSSSERAQMQAKHPYPSLNTTNLSSLWTSGHDSLCRYNLYWACVGGSKVMESKQWRRTIVATASKCNSFAFSQVNV